MAHILLDEPECIFFLLSMLTVPVVSSGELLVEAVVQGLAVSRQKLSSNPQARQFRSQGPRPAFFPRMYPKYRRLRTICPY